MRVCYTLTVFITTLYCPISLYAGSLVKDEAGRIMVVNDKAGQVDASHVIKNSEDAVYSDTIQSDSIRRKQYIDIVNAGVECAQQNKYAEATEKYLAAIKLEPELSYAYIDLSNAYWHLEKYEDSMIMALKAIVIDPNDARAYDNLGNAYCSLRKYKEAEAVYKKAKAIYEERGDLSGIKKMEESLEFLKQKAAQNKSWM